MRRRFFLTATAITFSTGTSARIALATPSQRIPLEVWKDPNCGCCNDWIAHMEQHGFTAKVHDVGNAAVRAQLGLPKEFASCHTALVNGYLLEGHIPATDVQKLLTTKPKALGLVVPGMPIGSPGMDGPQYMGRKDAYDVLLVTRNTIGQGVGTRVFSHYR